MLWEALNFGLFTRPSKKLDKKCTSLINAFHRRKFRIFGFLIYAPIQPNV